MLFLIVTFGFFVWSQSVTFVLPQSATQAVALSNPEDSLALRLSGGIEKYGTYVASCWMDSKDVLHAPARYMALADGYTVQVRAPRRLGGVTTMEKRGVGLETPDGARYFAGWGTGATLQATPEGIRVDARLLPSDSRGGSIDIEAVFTCNAYRARDNQNIN